MKTSDSTTVHDTLLTPNAEMTSESRLKIDNRPYSVAEDDYIIQYANKIESGEIVTCKRIASVYSELKERIINPDPESSYIFDKEKGNKVIRFFNQFVKHSKGKKAGQPFELELFQSAFIHALFGFVHKDTGLRQYREAFFMISRKHGKTFLASAVALYMLFEESGGEIYIIATKKEQANKTFEQCFDIVKQSESFSKHIRKRVSDLYFAKSLSKIQSLSSDSNTLDGLNSSCIIADEVHAWTDRNLYEVMRQSTSAREQPLILITTTAGTVTENIFSDLYQYACNVADKKIVDDTFLPIIYEQDHPNEYLNPKLWEKSNPALGTIKSREYLEEQVQRSVNDPNYLKGVLCKDFNILQNSSSSWLSFEDIENKSTFDLKDFEKFYFIGGLDLSVSKDLTCSTLLTIDRTTNIKYVKQMYWLPEFGFKERCEREQIPYDVWHERGFLRLSKGNSVNYSEVIDWFREMIEEYGIRISWIYYDRYNSGYIAEELERKGFKAFGVAQGAKSLSTPMKLLGADLQAKMVNYDNNPLTAWCLNNTGVKTDDNDNIRPVKAINDKHKIDGTSSLLDSYFGLHEKLREFKQAQPNKTIKADNVYHDSIAGETTYNEN